MRTTDDLQRLTLPALAILLVAGCASVSVSPSRIARRYDVAKTIHLVLVDPTPRERLAAFRLLMAAVGTAMDIDAESSMDMGLMTLSEELGDNVYVVEFAIVFPVASLDEPEANLVALSSRLVQMPGAGGGVISADRARAAAFERLHGAIESCVAVGKPLHGRVRIDPGL